MNFKDLLATFYIGKRNGNLTVKATRTQQRRIQHIRTIGRRDDDHALLSVKAVHLNKELVERLLALIMSPTHAVSAMATNGIDLINKHQARC